MTGRLRKLYGVIGITALLVLALAVLIASFRASPAPVAPAEPGPQLLVSVRVS